jgi:hypothetical protein
VSRGFSVVPYLAHSLVHCVLWQQLETGQAGHPAVALLASFGSWRRAAWNRPRRKQRVSRGSAHGCVYGVLRQLQTGQAAPLGVALLAP